MIRIVLLGRTGNHLFQYALGRVLAEKHGVPLVLDASWFNAAGWREVSHFLTLPLQAKVRRSPSVASRALRKFSGKHYWEYLHAPLLRESGDDQSFDPAFLAAPADCVLFGYFQTPLYFADSENELRIELTELLAARVPATSAWAKQLSSPKSVAVHVRRGDYLHHPVFAVCDEAYYQKAMDEMRCRVPGAHFFIFSDDPNWCRTAFHDRDTTTIDSGPAAADPLHDLCLMRNASHHIIANSTYSWWAAWLGRKPGQEVIMPPKWYAHSIKAPIEEKTNPGWTILR
ncbi:MAG: alpha-1,2-fucosyltransferase [Verrucomicrobiota bacterium]